jgi:hypothetical protein
MMEKDSSESKVQSAVNEAKGSIKIKDDASGDE